MWGDGKEEIRLGAKHVFESNSDAEFDDYWSYDISDRVGAKVLTITWLQLDSPNALKRSKLFLQHLATVLEKEAPALVEWSVDSSTSDTADPAPLDELFNRLGDESAWPDIGFRMEESEDEDPKWDPLKPMKLLRTPSRPRVIKYYIDNPGIFLNLLKQKLDNRSA